MEHWQNTASDLSLHCLLMPDPKVIKLFSRLINLKSLKFVNSFLLNIAEHDNFLLINMKMPTIVSRENFMFS